MRALLTPEDAGELDPGTADGLRAWYAPPPGGWLRANFVSSLDGAASRDGSSGGLGSPVDQQILALLRDQADAVLVGAGTVRAEGYGPITHSPERRRLRVEAGRAATARLAVVTGRLEVDGSESWIAGAPAPTLLLTTARAARPVPGAEVVVCGEDRVEVDRALDELTARGLESVVCEGGPGLFGQLASSRRLDELCLTTSPLLTGPGAGRIVNGAGWPDPLPARLHALLTDGGLLFARWLLAD